MAHYKSNTIVPLILLKEHPRNYKNHTEKQISKLVKALEKFGQVRSIVTQAQVDGTYLIVAGHGVVKAARKLNFTELRSDILPVNWSPEQVRGYLVADNKLHDETDIDEELLAALLLEQKSFSSDLDSLGSSDDELADLLTLYNEEDLKKLLEIKDIPFSPSIQKNEPLELSPKQISPSFPQNREIGSISSHEINNDDSFSKELNEYISPSKIEPYIPNIIGDIPAPPSREKPGEKLGKYEESLVRQIVLIFSPDEYAWMMAKLKQVRQTTKGLENNTDVVVHLIRSYTLHTGLPEVDVKDPFIQEMLHD